ncbi:uncharacterized protein LOC130368889 isoform X2 [Hyla sarda]|uniref:uncharacterized protein LOC130368889 isoform X2 n=1 Tax=Hyla sarda TaxID=327740 RepID=UPI0024C37900|nr:uncharacterized protein LOC130368889 isoform X2 [Hyla sarda]
MLFTLDVLFFSQRCRLSIEQDDAALFFQRYFTELVSDSGSLTKRAESPETAVTTRVCPRRSCRCPASCVYVHGLHGIKSWCTSLRHQPSTLKIYARSGVVRPPGPHRSQQGTSSHKGTT